jgi:hypothetical protein
LEKLLLQVLSLASSKNHFIFRDTFSFNLTRFLLGTTTTIVVLATLESSSRHSIGGLLALAFCSAWNHRLHCGSAFDSLIVHQFLSMPVVRVLWDDPIQLR